MRGRVADWKDERGFGFIEPASGGERVFFHINDVARGRPRPAVGDVVSYRLTTSPDGKSRAVQVGPAGLIAVSRGMLSRRLVLSVVALLVFPGLWWMGMLGRLPVLLFWAYGAMSVLAFALYGLDKWAARREGQRTPEKTLQLLALFGGWPGALLAQQLFRHKSSKRPFQVVFWIVVAINCGALGYFLSPGGAEMLGRLPSWP